MQIVYYSLNGTTEKISRQLAGQLDLPLYRIEDVSSRKGMFGFMRSGFESTFRKCPKIRPVEGFKPDGEPVLLLAPVWAGKLSSPMRSFCTQYAGLFKSFVLIMTHLDRKNRYEEIKDEIAAILGAECDLFDSFCAETFQPDEIQLLGRRLEEKYRV